MSSWSEDVAPPESLLKPLSIPHKTLLGPGPANCTPRVIHAASLPLVGHMHKECLAVMDEIKLGLQYVFQTRNTFTLAVSATGHGGMETCLGNLLEPGDTALITSCGLWGERAADMASRYGAKVEKLEKPAGENFSLAEIESALARHSPALLFVVQGESSTGVMQPLEGLGPLCHKYNCLLVVDTVASLGAVPLFVDRWEIDAVYSGSQKVLGAPPGLAPLSLSPRARAKLAGRKIPPPVFYFDLNLIGNYWGCDSTPRKYHHTIPVSLLYALREGIAGVVKEGLQDTWRRHAECTALLHSKVEKLGLRCFVPRPEARVPTISTFTLPTGVSIPSVTEYAMQRHNVEIAGGLGPTAGHVIRVGLMGFNATPGHVDLVVKVLKQALDASAKL